MRNRKSERLGSERQWPSIRVLVPKRVNSLHRSTFVPRGRDQFTLTDEKENLAPPVPSTTSAHLFIRKQVLAQ